MRRVPFALPPVLLLTLAVGSLGRSAEPAAAAAKPAARPAAGEVKFATERAVVFKDGHALLVKKAEGTADAQGRLFTEDVPEAAVLGTFWGWTTKGPAIQAMRAEWHEEDAPKPEPVACRTALEVLHANPGKVVTLEREKGEPLTGTLVGFARRPASVPVPAVEPSEAMAAAPSAETEPEFVALDVAQRGRVLLLAGDVRSVSGKDLTLECRPPQPARERRKRLVIELGAAAAGKGAAVQLLYFSPGFRWIPTYRLDAAEPKRGTLFLQAELINELEDLTNAAVDLVVGVPNFRFRSVVSPLSLETALRSAMTEAAPELMKNVAQMSNASFAQRASEWRGAEEDDGQGEAFNDGEDFFVYGVPNLSLAKGARAVVPLWRKDVPIRDVYTLEISTQRGNGVDQVQYGRTGGWSPLKLSRAQVWHQLEVKAPDDVPLTTGAALVLKGQIPQAQELLAYAPRGGTTLMPLTVAPDVRAFHDEVELDRKPGALVLHGREFVLIHKKGTLTLQNPRATKTPLQITLATGGKVDKVTGGGKVKIDDFKYDDWGGSADAAVNNHSEVAWSLELQPGEKRTLTYEVSFLR